MNNAESAPTFVIQPLDSSDDNPASEILFPPDSCDYWRVPYTPPVMPSSREEALFLLSSGGRNCLGDLQTLLSTYRRFLQDSESLAHGNAAVGDSALTVGMDFLEVEGVRKKFELSLFFSGFADLGVWLSGIFSKLVTLPVPRNAQKERCVDVQWMAEFSQDIAAQKDITVITLLFDSLCMITDIVDRQWGIKAYWDLMIARLQAAAGMNDAKYAGKSVLKDRNSRTDRQDLHDSLMHDGLFAARFLDFFPDDDVGSWDPVDERHYKPAMIFLQNLLLSSDPMTIRDVYAKIVNDSRPMWLWSEPCVYTGTKRIETGASAESRGSEPNTADTQDKDNPIGALDHVHKQPAERQVCAEVNKKANPNVLLLKFALRYRAKGCKPTAKLICNEPPDIKSCSETIAPALSKMQKHTISRAKKDMETEGYQFATGYQLTNDSYDRLAIEVDANRALYEAICKNAIAKPKKKSSNRINSK